MIVFIVAILAISRKLNNEYDIFRVFFILQKTKARIQPSNIISLCKDKTGCQSRQMKEMGPVPENGHNHAFLRFKIYKTKSELSLRSSLITTTIP